MTKKFTVKTTKEFEYNEKGFITREVITEESYEEEIATIKQGNIIESGQIRLDSASSEILKKTTGVLPNEPYTATFNNHDTGFVVSNSGDVEVTGTVTGDFKADSGKADTNGITHNITINSAKLNAKAVNEIANEVKLILEKALRKRRV